MGEIDHALDLHELLRDGERARVWIGVREEILASEDVGGSLDEVETLLKKHDDFEKSLGAYEAKFAFIQRKSKVRLREDRDRLREDRDVASFLPRVWVCG